MEKKLSAMPYAQAKVRMLSGCYHNELISYQTTVAAIRDGWLYIYGLYSATTRRHIGAYVKEYANIDYQLAKKLYNDGMKYNIYTGEVAPFEGNLFIFRRITSKKLLDKKGKMGYNRDKIKEGRIRNVLFV